MQLSRAHFANNYLSKDDVVADISCASGYLSEILKFKKYFGVDHPETISMVKSTGIHQKPSVTFVHCDFEDIKDLSLGEEVDKIVSFETIEHLEDPERFLYNLNKNMKTGGQLVLSTPNNPTNREPRYIHHVKEYSLDEMQKMLDESGFEVNGSYTMGVPFEFLRRIVENVNVKTYRSDPSEERGILSRAMDYSKPIRNLYCTFFPYRKFGINIGNTGSGMMIVSSKR